MFSVTNWVDLLRVVVSTQALFDVNSWYTIPMARMLRRTKSSSLLPIVRLTNYFYPEDPKEPHLMEVYSHAAASGTSRGRPPGTLTPPPDYEQLYQAMQLDTVNETDRVRKKYACQGTFLPPCSGVGPFHVESGALCVLWCVSCGLRWNGLSVGLKLVASALAEEGSSIGSRSESDILFSKELYINGVEYILRGLPRTPLPRPLFLH